VPFSDWTLDTERAINNMINNITLFFPFGFLLQMSSKKKVLCGYAIWIPLLISLLTETIQYLLSLGVGDITDVIMNTIGATVGAIAYLLFCIFFQNRVEKASEILLYLFGVFTIIVIILWM
jgi:glycopeptide antibiotics resistance protein